jgi:hypothetical protein
MPDGPRDPRDPKEIERWCAEVHRQYEAAIDDLVAKTEALRELMRPYLEERRRRDGRDPGSQP